MISGPNGIYICDECISLCADAMMRDLGMQAAQDQRSHGVYDAVDAQVEPVDAVPNPEEILENLPTPHELYQQLSEYVVGQEPAKKALSVESGIRQNPPCLRERSFPRHVVFSGCGRHRQVHNVQSPAHGVLHRVPGAAG